MTPVLYVKVVVDPLVGKSTLNIFKIELIGSRIAEIANGTFDGMKCIYYIVYRACVGFCGGGGIDDQADRSSRPIPPHPTEQADRF